MKTTLTLFIAALLLVFALADNTKAAVTAQTTQTLHLTILPAIESFTANEASQETPTTLTKELTVAVRSNTPWFVSYQPVSQGFIAAPICTDSGQTGPSNGEAGIGDGWQLMSIRCQQEKSWADASGAFLQIVYSSSSIPTL